MKKIITIIVTLMLVVLSCFSLTACGTQVKDLDDIIKSGKLSIATEATFAPFEYKEGTKFKGIDIEIAQAIADYLGVELEVKDMEFDAVVTSVQNGQADLGIAALTISDERKKSIDFSDNYFGASQYIIVKTTDTNFDACVTKEDVDTVLSGLSGEVGAQIATTGYYYIKGSEDFEFEGFSNLIAKSYDSAVLAATAVANGQVICAVVDDEVANQLVASISGLRIIAISLSSEQYGIGVNKNNTALKFVVNKVLAELKESGKLNEIILSYTAD